MLPTTTFPVLSQRGSDGFLWMVLHTVNGSHLLVPPPLPFRYHQLVITCCAVWFSSVPFRWFNTPTFSYSPFLCFTRFYPCIPTTAHSSLPERRKGEGRLNSTSPVGSPFPTITHQFPTGCHYYHLTCRPTTYYALQRYPATRTLLPYMHFDITTPGGGHGWWLVVDVTRPAPAHTPPLLLLPGAIATVCCTRFFALPLFCTAVRLPCLVAICVA